MKSEPKVVLISDIHFNLNTLETASAALSQALDTAQQYRIPLVIAGDLNDSKAILRGEVANRLIRLLKSAIVPVHILVGNHDLLNEKGIENSLEFLRPYATIVDVLSYNQELDLYLLPYQSNRSELLEKIKLIPIGSTVIMHQGFLGAHMGEYVQDHSSISTDLVSHLRVFSGHYHRHQTLGTVTYIGTPYTVSFAEANDGGKGFLVLNSDNSFERIYAHRLRKHVCVSHTVESFKNTAFDDLNSYDILWLKIKGTREELSNFNSVLNSKEFMPDFVKVELIVEDKEYTEITIKDSSATEIFNKLITDEGSESLMALFKEVMDEDL